MRSLDTGTLTNEKPGDLTRDNTLSVSRASINFEKIFCPQQQQVDCIKFNLKQALHSSWQVREKFCHKRHGLVDVDNKCEVSPVTLTWHVIVRVSEGDTNLGLVRFNPITKRSGSLNPLFQFVCTQGDKEGVSCIVSVFLYQSWLYLLSLQCPHCPPSLVILVF